MSFHLYTWVNWGREWHGILSQKWFLILSPNISPKCEPVSGAKTLRLCPYLFTTCDLPPPSSHSDSLNLKKPLKTCIPTSLGEIGVTWSANLEAPWGYGCFLDSLPRGWGWWRRGPFALRRRWGISGRIGKSDPR